MVSSHPLIPKSSSPPTNPLVTALSAPITISIAVTLCSNVFFSSYLFFRFHSVLSCGKVHYSAGSLFCWLSQGLVVWPRLDDPFVSQNPRELCASRLLGRILGCAYTICSYGQILISGIIPSGSHCITKLCLVLFSFCDNLLYSLIMWLIVSSLSWHNLYLLFCCVLPILALT